MTNKFCIRTVAVEDLDRCFEIETTAYAGDEAATKEKIHRRIVDFPEGFIVLENDAEVVGFINSGATHAVSLSDEAFKDLKGHDSTGSYIVVLSVVVHPDYQRQGLAGKLISTFVRQMITQGRKAIYLICQTELIPMYAAQGFIDLGPSESDHGGLSWHEMVLRL